MGKVGIERIERGSLFQEVGPATEKERCPTVDSLVFGVQRMKESELERSVRAGE